MKLEQAIILNSALEICAQEKGLDPSVNYAIARNLKRLKPIIKSFNEDNEERINIYAQKNEAGEPVIIGNKYDFGDKQSEANEKYKELINSEVEFEPYTINKSEGTDKLPTLAQVELLDIIIIG